MEILAAIENGGTAFIFFTVMVVAIFTALFLSIGR